MAHKFPHSLDIGTPRAISKSTICDNVICGKGALVVVTNFEQSLTTTNDEQNSGEPQMGEETPIGCEVHLMGIQTVMGPISNNNQGKGARTCIKNQRE